MSPREVALLALLLVPIVAAATGDEFARAQAAGQANGVHIPVNWDWTARVYFRKDWCPSASVLKQLQSDHLVVTSGCCIDFVEAQTPESSWRTLHPAIQPYTSPTADQGLCIPLTDEQRQAKERQRTEAEAAASLAASKQVVAEQRKQLPSELRGMGTSELCAAYGFFLRNRHFAGYLELAQEALRPAKSELQRRGLRVNDADIKAEVFRVGSTECSVLAAFGNPDAVNRSVSASRVSKQIIYRDINVYVYTVNGVVTSWQD